MGQCFEPGRRVAEPMNGESVIFVRRSAAVCRSEDLCSQARVCLATKEFNQPRCNGLIATPGPGSRNVNYSHFAILVRRTWGAITIRYFPPQLLNFSPQRRYELGNQTGDEQQSAEKHE